MYAISSGVSDSRKHPADRLTASLERSAFTCPKYYTPFIGSRPPFPRMPNSMTESCYGYQNSQGLRLNDNNDRTIFGSALKLSRFTPRPVQSVSTGLQQTNYPFTAYSPTTASYPKRLRVGHNICNRIYFPGHPSARMPLDYSVPVGSLKLPSGQFCALPNPSNSYQNFKLGDHAPSGGTVLPWNMAELANETAVSPFAAFSKALASNLLITLPSGPQNSADRNPTIPCCLPKTIKVSLPGSSSNTHKADVSKVVTSVPKTESVSSHGCFTQGVTCSTVFKHEPRKRKSHCSTMGPTGLLLDHSSLSTDTSLDELVSAPLEPSVLANLRRSVMKSSSGSDLMHSIPNGPCAPPNHFVPHASTAFHKPNLSHTGRCVSTLDRPKSVVVRDPSIMYNRPSLRNSKKPVLPVSVKRFQSSGPLAPKLWSSRSVNSLNSDVSGRLVSSQISSSHLTSSSAFTVNNKSVLAAHKSKSSGSFLPPVTSPGFCPCEFTSLLAEDILWKCNFFGQQNPEQLTCTLVYLFSRVLGLRSGQELRQLRHGFDSQLRLVYNPQPGAFTSRTNDNGSGQKLNPIHPALEADLCQRIDPCRLSLLYRSDADFPESDVKQRTSPNFPPITRPGSESSVLRRTDGVTSLNKNPLSQRNANTRLSSNPSCTSGCDLVENRQMNLLTPTGACVVDHFPIRNHERCLVCIHSFYLSKRPSLSGTRSDPYFLSWSPNPSSKIWFRPRPLGENHLSGIMHAIKSALSYAERTQHNPYPQSQLAPFYFGETYSRSRLSQLIADDSFVDEDAEYNTPLNLVVRERKTDSDKEFTGELTGTSRLPTHPTCLDYWPELTDRARQAPWQCADCKTCAVCQNKQPTVDLLICDACDKGFHPGCHSPKLQEPVDRSLPWVCSDCQKEGYSVAIGTLPNGSFVSPVHALDNTSVTEKSADQKPGSEGEEDSSMDRHTASSAIETHQSEDNHTSSAVKSEADTPTVHMTANLYSPSVVNRETVSVEQSKHEFISELRGSKGPTHRSTSDSEASSTTRSDTEPAVSNQASEPSEISVKDSPITQGRDDCESKPRSDMLPSASCPASPLPSKVIATVGPDHPEQNSLCNECPEKGDMETTSSSDFFDNLENTPNHEHIIRPTDVRLWTVDQVREWLLEEGFPREAEAFLQQEIDGACLLLMKRMDVLTELGIKLGPAVKIYERIKRLQSRCSSPTVLSN